MSRIFTLALVGLMVLSMVVVACTPAQASVPTPTQQPAEPTAAPTDEPATPGQVDSLEDLIEVLRSMGMTVELGDPTDDSLFGGEGHFLIVNGVSVQVFEYATEAAREDESSQITPGGDPNGHVVVEWIAPPHFWAAGRLIVLYVGRDEAFVGQLTSVLGEPVAVGPGGFLPPNAQAVAVAVNTLAEARGIATDDISVVSAEEVEWTDSCLGLGGIAESCLAAITPGYNVLLSADGTEYEVHTNLDGSVVRIKE